MISEGHVAPVPRDLSKGKLLVYVRGQPVHYFHEGIRNEKSDVGHGCEMQSKAFWPYINRRQGGVRRSQAVAAKKT